MASTMDWNAVHHHTRSQAPARVSDDEVVVFNGGPIITMAGGTFSPVEALAIAGGKIVAAGSLDSVEQVATQLAGKPVTPTSLGKRCLLPGFVEPHLHFLFTALATTLVDVSPWTTPTMESVKKALHSAAQSTKTGWVVAYGFDPSLVKHHPDMNKDTLDTISTSIQIFVLNQSAHIAYVNQAALSAANIHKDTHDPPNGTIGRVSEIDKTPNGILYESPAINLVAKNIPPTPPDTFLKACNKTMSQWSSMGFTTVFDAGVGMLNPTNATDVTTMAKLSQSSTCPLRFRGALIPTVATYVKATPPYQAGNAVFAAIKFWADGSTQGFTAALTEPYLNKTTTGKLNYANASDLQHDMSPWFAGGWQLIVHSNGDRATDQALDVYEALLGTQPDPRPTMVHRVDHFTVTKPSQFPRLAALRLGVSHTIGHVYYWGETFETYVLGNPRAQEIDPVQSDVDAGLVYSFHSDSPLYAPNALLYLSTAVTRRMQVGGGVLGPDQCVTLEQALCGVTVNPAKQVLLWDTVGSLEVGKSADLVILSQDPRTVDPTSWLDQLTVEETWFQGKQVFVKNPQ